MRCAGVLLFVSLAACLGCQQEAVPLAPAQYVEQVDESNFQERVLNSPVPVLVNFYADWCGPCKMMAPLLEEIATGNQAAKVVKVNVDRSQRLAVHYQVRGIPDLKVFRNGKVVAHHVGFADIRRLESLLSQ